jgi:hypothetical protein
MFGFVKGTMKAVGTIAVDREELPCSEIEVAE